MSTSKGIFVVAGYGNGTGTGAASAFLFANAGYKVALIARRADDLKAGAEKIKSSGGDAAAFPVTKYDEQSIHEVFEAIKKHWPDEHIRVTLYNNALKLDKPFLELTQQDWQSSIDDNFLGAIPFARESILAFQPLPLNEYGKRGTLLFTGATASWRGNVTTSAFAAGKFALRSLSQSLNKEFGKQNIHVAHAIIDGLILTDKWKNKNRATYDAAENDPNVRLSPEGIAGSYLYLAHQDRSAWTWELDLRPAHERW
ncbi:NAD-P-binding protein [Sistotremastrum niveocremeum HHB9708]|uniref:NAD-P-binding protein n=2 Tax=Sistotremastraceae TaxID=3402574 RepID=A0A164Y6Y7_9AGAM|nr:NAD-P-binding protein [Sistotremastrum niveocremeum HHB9708]KZT42330.1 short-chain dehydrogenase/reductase SDR [Sistotremastrum suecicum HHB10207 ss-3]